MLLSFGRYRLELLNEPDYSPGSADNLRRYVREYVLTDSPYMLTSRHGIILRDQEAIQNSCVLLACGGRTTIHEHSAVITGEACYLGVGDMLCSLDLPSLDLQWSRQVDTATCFGVHYCSARECLIVHGECEITRLSLSGEVAWCSTGGDIFTNGFRLFENHVEAFDFNETRYHFDLDTGEATAVPRRQSN